jgi:hypothetical protein
MLSAGLSALGAALVFGSASAALGLLERIARAAEAAPAWAADLVHLRRLDPTLRMSADAKLDAEQSALERLKSPSADQSRRLDVLRRRGG